MRATTAALNYGCKTGPAAHQAAARTVAHPRAMFGTCWASPGPAGLHMTQGGQRTSPTLPALRAYSYEAVATDAAQIVEVDYDPAAANSVRLIGVLGGKKDLKVFERSKLLPFSIGLKDKRRPDEIEWMNVEAWGPLAERADQQLQKGDRVAVQGRLKIERWDDRVTGLKRTAVKIVANSISKVRSNYGDQQQQAGAGGYEQQQQASAAAGGAPWDSASFPEPAPWDAPPAPGPVAAPTGGAGGGGSSGQQQTVEELWMDFFMAPDKWYDNRTTKRNPKGPDFKKKVGGSTAPALWVEGRGTPGWVLTELQRLDSLSGGEA
ncbi:hypothetical protein D9Q98_002430 [Chlorella vulgaris]|uniref:Uncharacterized protein n=1 Tax=Chlorella vulgaris TaxID=3077 RepID=A0A9D4TWH7_CHLVU|nr:hypothetical protein D9Q98_002430 [Chlorella vulgaris]